MKEKELADLLKVNCLNNLIEAAVKNGADAGGSYDQAKNELKEAINNMLIAMGLNNEYCVATYKDHWSPFYVVKKTEFDYYQIDKKGFENELY